MSDEITKFEEHRAKLAASLSSVAESMKTAAALAESFAAMVKDSSFSGADGDAKKSRKRKGTADDADDKSNKRKRKVKDPNAPKRPASSYIMFQNDIRKDLKEKNPHLSNPDLLALISQKWSEMSEEEKSVYTKANASAKEQYSNEKKAYEARSPEEVAAANAAVEAALAAKKSKPRAPRASKPTGTTPASAPAETSPSANDNSNTSDSESDDSDDSSPAPAPKKSKTAAAPVVTVSDSEEEASDEEDDESSEEEEAKPAPQPVKVKEKVAKVKTAPVQEKVPKKKAPKQ